MPTHEAQKVCVHHKPPLKCWSKWCCCYRNTSVFLSLMCQISTDFHTIVQWRFFSINLNSAAFYTAHTPVSEVAFCEAAQLLFLLFTLWVQSEPLCWSHPQHFCVDSMSVNLWDAHLAQSALAAGFSLFFFSWRVLPMTNLKGGCKCCLKKKSVSLCVINFCSLLWKTGK